MTDKEIRKTRAEMINQCNQSEESRVDMLYLKSENGNWFKLGQSQFMHSGVITEQVLKDHVDRKRYGTTERTGTVDETYPWVSTVPKEIVDLASNGQFDKPFIRWISENKYTDKKLFTINLTESERDNRGLELFFNDESKLSDKTDVGKDIAYLLDKWFSEYCSLYGSEYSENKKRVIFNGGREIQKRSVETLDSASKKSIENRDKMTKVGIFIPPRSGKTAISEQSVVNLYKSDNRNKYFLYYGYKADSQSCPPEDGEKFEEFKDICFVRVQTSGSNEHPSNTFILNPKAKNATAVVERIKKHNGPVIFCATVQTLFNEETLQFILDNFSFCGEFWDEAHHGSKDVCKIYEIKRKILKDAEEDPEIQHFYDIAITATPTIYTIKHYRREGNCLVYTEFDRQAEKMDNPTGQWKDIPFIHYLGVLPNDDINVANIFSKKGKNRKDYMLQEPLEFMKRVLIDEKDSLNAYNAIGSTMLGRINDSNFKGRVVDPITAVRKAKKFDILCIFSPQASGVSFIRSLAKICNEDDILGKRFEFIAVDSKNDGIKDIYTLRERMKEARHKGKISVIFSCGKFQQSSTIETLALTLRFDDTTSPQAYVQANSRGQNPCTLGDGEAKEDAYILDYNMYRMLVINDKYMRQSDFAIKGDARGLSAYDIYSDSYSISMLYAGNWQTMNWSRDYKNMLAEAFERTQTPQYEINFFIEESLPAEILGTISLEMFDGIYAKNSLGVNIKIESTEKNKANAKNKIEKEGRNPYIGENNHEDDVENNDEHSDDTTKNALQLNAILSALRPLSAYTGVFESKALIYDIPIEERLWKMIMYYDREKVRKFISEVINKCKGKVNTEDLFADIDRVYLSKVRLDYENKNGITSDEFDRKYLGNELFVKV